MVDVNRMHTAPVQVARTRRNHPVQVLTSGAAGKMVPIAAIPMFRQDSLNAQVSVAVEMLETHELFVNPVKLRVTAYLVPFLAFERFEGSRDQFDRSYMGQPKVEGGAVVPFIETQAMGTFGSNAVYKALGLHAKPADTPNTAYLEAYNAVWNFRAKNRSKHITPRARLATTLAPAFWMNGQFEHVVPDFDQAVIDGEVALNVVMAGTAPVVADGVMKLHGTTNGLGRDATLRPSGTLSNGAAGGVALNLYNAGGGSGSDVWGNTTDATFVSGLKADLSSVLGEMGATISLSNLDLARKTQAFAKLRARYEGIEDEYIIDMLMNGLEIPDQALKQPILLADQTTTIRQAKRFATDASNLAESATSGGAVVNVRVRVPEINTGGIVMVFAECVPDQLFERRADPFFFATNNRDEGELVDFPAALRDELDPEKVDRVLNREIDTDHATPTGTFGFVPMNWKWNGAGPKIGGKFLRPTTDTVTDVERRRIWAIEPVNPVLTTDFYVVNSMHLKGFLDEVADPFEFAAVGNAVIGGETVFGGVLVEATGNYDKVLVKAPQERLVK